MSSPKFYALLKTSSPIHNHTSMNRKLGRNTPRYPDDSLEQLNHQIHQLLWREEAGAYIADWLHPSSQEPCSFMILENDRFYECYEYEHQNLTDLKPLTETEYETYDDLLTAKFICLCRYNKLKIRAHKRARFKK